MVCMIFMICATYELSNMGCDVGSCSNLCGVHDLNNVC